MDSHPPRAARAPAISFALTVLLSAFLLFQVQPVLGRFLVPKFGGGAGIWTTCLLFFQTMLLAGYGYAHWLGTRLSPLRQAIVHGSLLALSLVFLPLLPEGGVATTTTTPALQILVLLTLRVGLPYGLLAATAPLLQSWYRQSGRTGSPYRLYAISNLGSLIALVSYPFLVEPLMSLRAQGWVWTTLYVVFAGACAITAWQLVRAAASHVGESRTPRESASRPAFSTLALWAALAATGSVFMLATTSRVSEDLAAMPLLWVAPLATYLLTFTICFDRERWYDRRVFVTLFAVAAVATVLLPTLPGFASTWVQIGVHMLLLFAACMVCHGELVRARPRAEQLTMFYLVLALGGALGGAFVAIVAPAVFPDYWEYPLAIIATGVLAMICVYRSERGRITPRVLRVRVGLGYILLLGTTVTLTARAWMKHKSFVESARNFYGVLHVEKKVDSFGRKSVVMLHGTTDHGKQFLDPQRSRWPTAYYGHESGIGIAIDSCRQIAEDGSLSIGVVGLGAGTLATHCRAGERVRFYEINPDVERLARARFRFLSACRGSVEVAIGDARQLLEQELAAGAAQRFDVLAIDAFSSHAIPTHLLTSEAFAAYDAHVRDRDGVVAFHLSHRFLDLVPVVRGLASEHGYAARVVVSPGNNAGRGTRASTWVLVTKNQRVLDSRRVRLLAERASDSATARLWTDESSSLLPLLTFEGHRGRWDVAPNRGNFLVDGAELMARDEADRLDWQLRELFADTEGECALMVVTFRGIPPKYGAAQAAFQSYKAALFRDLGLARNERGLMLVLGTADRKLSLEFGSGWRESDESRAKAVLGSTIVPALQRGAPSAAITEGVLQLDRIMRQTRVAASPK